MEENRRGEAHRVQAIQHTAVAFDHVAPVLHPAVAFDRRHHQAAGEAGFAGGLVMSAIKRDRGVKDWGHMIEGHGGMLDRLDSVCFAAPVFFHMVRYWWA